MELQEIIYRHQMGSRSRKAWALVIGPGDQVEEFQGQSIPGKLVVIGEDYKRDGKWSHTTYRIALAEGVSFISGHMGWETGSWIEGLGDAANRSCHRWSEVAKALGVSVAAAQAYMRARYPKTSARLDQTEIELFDLRWSK